MIDMTPMLRPERATLLDLLRGLSPDDWHRPTECPAWDVKGVALHVLGDDLSLLTRQRDQAVNSLMLYAVDHPGLNFRELLDGFNEQWVVASRFFSNEILIEMLQLVGDWSDTFYCEVGLETMSGEPVGLFATTEPSPYWQVIAREYLERFVHQSQMRRALGTGELAGELVTAVAETVVHVLAAWMRDYAPATGSVIAIDFDTVGAWAWERAEDRWVVRDGDVDRAQARIAVAPADTVAMCSRGMSADEVAARVDVTGDESLARGAMQVVAPIVSRPAA